MSMSSSVKRMQSSPILGRRPSAFHCRTRRDFFACLTFDVPGTAVPPVFRSKSAGRSHLGHCQSSVPSSTAVCACRLSRVHFLWNGSEQTPQRMGYVLILIRPLQDVHDWGFLWERFMGLGWGMAVAGEGVGMAVE